MRVTSLTHCVCADVCVSVTCVRDYIFIFINSFIKMHLSNTITGCVFRHTICEVTCVPYMLIGRPCMYTCVCVLSPQCRGQQQLRWSRIQTVRFYPSSHCSGAAWHYFYLSDDTLEQDTQPPACTISDSAKAHF